LKKADITSNITFTPDSKCVAVNLIGDMSLLELESGKTLYTITDCPFMKPVFRPDGEIFAGCWGRQTVSFFDTKTAKHLPTCVGHLMPVQGSVWTADSKEVLMWSHSEQLVWNPQDGKLVRTGRALPNFGGMRWTSDYRNLVTAGPKRETQIQIWDAKTLERTQVFPNLHQHLVGCFAVSSDDKRIVTGSAGTVPDEVMLWDLKTGRKLWKEPITSSFAIAVEFLSGNENILLVEHEATRVISWDSGQEPTSRELLRIIAPTVALSHNKRLLAITQVFDSNQWKGRTIVVEIATGKNAIEFGRDFEGRSVVFSSDDQTCFVGGKDDQVHIFDVVSGKELAAINTGRGYGFSVSPDNRLLVCPGKGMEAMTPLVWDVAKSTGRERVAFNAATVGQVQQWCKQLLDPESTVGIAAVWHLADNPKLALPALREQFVRAHKTNAKRLAELIGELDDPKYQVRETATAELVRQGFAAREAIEKALAQNPSLEQQRRLVAVRSKILDARYSPELLFSARSMMVLEQIRSKEARKLLEIAAKGEPTARLTRDATAALARWKSEDENR
jgi:WD40 repeat protein